MAQIGLLLNGGLCTIGIVHLATFQKIYIYNKTDKKATQHTGKKAITSPKLNPFH